MKICIVEEELPAAPGIYGYKISKDDFSDIVLKGLPFYWFPLLWIFLLGKNAASDKKELQRIANIPKPSNILGNNPGRIYYDEAIIIPNTFLKGEYDLYSDKIFCGTIKSREHLEKLLPPNQYYEITIIPVRAARALFPDTAVSRGLNILDEENKVLYPLQTYSSNKWQRLEVNIANCFNNLGANEIRIKDTTDINGMADVGLDAIASKFNAKVHINKEFSFYEKWNESVRNVNKAATFLPALQDCPQFYHKAQELINTPRTGKIEFSETLDVSFGMDLQVLAAFQGSFAGGYNRKISIEITIG